MFLEEEWDTVDNKKKKIIANFSVLLALENISTAWGI